MLVTGRRTVKILAATAVFPVGLLLAGSSAAIASPVTTRRFCLGSTRPAAWRPSTYRVRRILNGMKLRHTFTPAGSATRRSEPLTSPDDITVLGHHIFTAFQNGIGPQGQPSSDGNTDSTIVEFTAAGRVIRQWDIKGKCDGVTADAGRRRLIATVNEDANSSVYTIKPDAPASEAQVRHYFGHNRPLPHQGGTDAISIYHGRVLISASAPGTTGKAAPQPTYPAVYSVRFIRSVHVAPGSRRCSTTRRARLSPTPVAGPAKWFGWP